MGEIAWEIAITIASWEEANFLSYKELTMIYDIACYKGKYGKFMPVHGTFARILIKTTEFQ